jgi:phosphatidylserine/phosphatidylglycerophosphate/cardiolipin synthase-like enzyme
MPVSARIGYRFPWNAGHRFRLLVDGDEFYAAMLASIANARHFVLLEMYLLEPGHVADRFVATLCAAARRGVAVYVLLDGYGAHRLRRRDRQRFLDAGVEVAFFNPLKYLRWSKNLFRNHRKLLLVDGEIAYTGGAGISDVFDPGLQAGRHWHETMLEIRGPSVADWQSLFTSSWDRWAETPLQLPTTTAEPSTGQGALGRVVAHNRSMVKSEIMRSFVTHIRHARERVWLATAYFAPPWKLRRALRRAARRGADVRVMLPGPQTDHPAVRHLGSRYYDRLLRNGVRIFEYQPRFLHAKVLLCDGWLSIGSTNGDRWNYHLNLEANQELRDTEIIGQVRDVFEKDFSHCTEQLLGPWRHRSWRRRWPEWFWGKVAALLARFGIPYNNGSGPGFHR